MKKDHKTTNSFIYAVLSVLVLLNSCIFSGNFPLTINDIDTLSIYRRYHDSIKTSKQPISEENINTAEMPPIQDSLAMDSSSIESIIPSENWTICTGSFRVKQNAEQKFREMQNNIKPYMIIRDSLYFVTTGIFESRDAALQYRRNAHFRFENYILKLKPGDQILSTLPN